MVTKTITIINKLGLHARAAAKLVTTINSFSSMTTIQFNDKKVDGKSIMAVMMLAAAKGSALEFSIDGTDEQDAMEAIEALINRYFDEGE